MSKGIAQKLSDDKMAPYLKLLEIHNQNRIDYNDRKWETIKFSQTLFAALISVTGAGIWAIQQHILGDDLFSNAVVFKPGDYLLCSAVTVVLILALVVLWFAQRNLEGESYRGFREEAQYIQILNFLQLPYDLKFYPNKLWLKGEPNLILPKWHDVYEGTKMNKNKVMEWDIDAKKWIQERLQYNEFSKVVKRLLCFETVVTVVAFTIVWGEIFVRLFGWKWYISTIICVIIATLIALKAREFLRRTKSVTKYREYTLDQSCQLKKQNITAATFHML